MCGIAGEFRFDGTPVDRATVRAMVAAVSHRGPDASGDYVNGPIGLGHARLAIVDLSPDGIQPMSNEDGTVWVTFNGEIYNYRELREDLPGHRFKSATDTEVLVHLYEEHGPSFVSMLRGMFAFALWDARAERLMLARDRVGKKPLFYSVGPRSIRFASEIAPLAALTSREVDPLAIHYYLTFQYVPAPMTAFARIRRLPPATTMIVERTGECRLERYWRLPYGQHVDVTENEAIERTLELLDQATADRLMGDVPVGAFLSGGVDSGLVVSSMAMQSETPVQTFNIGFEEGSHDEAPYARQVAERYGTDHHEFVLRPNAIEVLPDLIRHFGEPFADSSSLPTFYVAQQTSRSVKVVLSGDGGDESFGGYGRYAQWQRLAPLSAVLPAAVRRELVATRYSRLTGSPVAAVARRIKRGARFAALDGPSRYLELLSYFPPGEKAELYTDEFAATVGGHSEVDMLRSAWEAWPGMTDLDHLSCTDVENYLPDDLLVKVDIMTMYHGLEARAPFLDHRLMEYAATLPDNLKVRGGRTKYLLKKAALRRLPRELVLRPKMGFAIPMADWLRGELRSYATDLLLDETSTRRGYFKPEMVAGLLDDHFRGTADNALRIWALLCLEVWHREFVDPPGAAASGGVPR